MFVSLFGNSRPRELTAVDTQQKKYTAQVSQFARKVGLFAVGLFAIVAASNLPMAEASYGECFANCVRGGTPPWICAILCAVIRR
ncbi:MAG: hypothetical protein K1X28_04425 [Parachlamydiales bacterium]|nr:hypothetical protein [Parachlamydiales bacterium]